MYCNGNGVYTGTWTSTSDGRLKKEMKGVVDALTIIQHLQPKQYEFRTREYAFLNLAEGTHYGFEAQELETVLPELVGQASAPISDDKNPEMFEFKTLNTIELIPILTRAIQEQQEMIETLQIENQSLTKQVDKLSALHAEIAELKRMMESM
jgi:hypothetical protein